MKEECPDQKKVAAIKKHILDRKKIKEYLRNGGDIDDLDTKEFNFNQPI